jgi:uncharacterized protein
MEDLMKIGSRLRFAVLSLLTLVCAPPAPLSAQEPTPAAMAAAREMLVAKGGLTFFDPVVPGVIESVKNTFLPTNLNLSRELNEVAAQLTKDFDSKRGDVITNVTRIFAERFTEQELKQITAFYKTPIGQKMIKEEPAAIEQSLKVTQDWVNSFSETVMARFRAEMRKRGHEL